MRAGSFLSEDGREPAVQTAPRTRAVQTVPKGERHEVRQSGLADHCRIAGSRAGCMAKRHQPLAMAGGVCDMVGRGKGGMAGGEASARRALV
jgi:hypothetical protein